MRPADVLVVAALPASDVQKLLADLLGVEVRVRPGGLPSGGAGLAGLYVDGTGRHSAAVWLDRSLAASAGASPVSAADVTVEAPDGDALPDRLPDDAGELFRLFGSILNGGRRVKLDCTVETPPAPAPLSDLFAGPVDPAWFTVEVAGRGSGVALVVQGRTGLSAAA